LAQIQEVRLYYGLKKMGYRFLEMVKLGIYLKTEKLSVK
jgi:hypothetical protein